LAWFIRFAVDSWDAAELLDWLSKGEVNKEVILVALFIVAGVAIIGLKVALETGVIVPAKL